LHGYEDEAWPPIRGVLHAAGVLETALATHTDRALLQRVLSPKLHGARNLDRLLPDVERFVLISSNSATLGVPGMGSYAAANAGLDALAHDRRCRKLHALSIQSGAWIDTGMHSGESAGEKMRQLNDIGIQGLTPAEGVAVFSALAGRSDAAITVMPIDWAAFTKARRGRNLQLYDGRLVPDTIAPTADAALSARFGSATASERRQLLEPIVREAVGRVLKLAPARIEPRRPLGAMGLNSLMAMELRNRLESDLGRPLSATLAWNYPTVDALVAFLSGDTPAAAARPAVAAMAPSAIAAFDAVANLSDLDAARLLRRKR
jgi:myxalamid-type polyketide synthase MxaE and MxaD